MREYYQVITITPDYAKIVTWRDRNFDKTASKYDWVLVPWRCLELPRAAWPESLRLAAG